MEKKTPRTRLCWWLPGAVFLLAVVLAPGPAAADLTVDTSEGNSPYTMTGDLNNANEYIGTTAGGGVFNQGGFTNTVTTGLGVGVNSGSIGTYNLSGGTLSASTYGLETIGVAGTGTFSQTGGANTASNGLYLGFSAGGSGVYNLSGGSVTADYAYIGYAGSGAFTQTGGSHTVTTDLSLGYNEGSSGSYSLSGSTLSVAGSEYIGCAGSGAFTQSGGSHTVGGNLILGMGILGENTGASGAYSLSGGSLTVNGDEIVGNLGSGTFTQTGGINTVNGNELTVGDNAPGSYTLQGGSLVVSSQEFIGGGLLAPGEGTFVQTSGSNTTAILAVGVISGPGTFTLNGGSLVARSTEILGGGGATGSFIQTGGTNTVTGDLVLGYDWLEVTGTGTYALSGGSLTVSGTVTPGNEYVGNYGSGAFTQSGGANTMTGDLYLGYISGASGSYNLSDSGSGSTLSVGGSEYIGFAGTGAFTQTGGTNTVSSLYLGDNAGAGGTYNLSDSGSGSTLAVAGSEYIGNSGTGAFTQSGGTNTVTNNLYLGYNAGAIGTYTQSGGSLSTIDSYIGSSGSGTFTQTGGTHTVTNNLSLGDQAGSSGTYNLSGGELNTFYSTIGSSGAGTFNQSGGTHSIDRSFSLGLNPGSSGTYNLSGGGLGTNMSIIGYAGSGTFNQSGGDHVVFTNLVLGSNTGSIGSYNQSGGSLTELNDAIIGYAGSGAFTQAGGDHTVFVDLILGNSSGASGTYNLGGGSLSIGGTITPGNAYIGNSGSGIFTQTGGSLTVVGDEVIGFSGSGVFTQSGGSNTVTNNLYLGYNAGASGTYTLSGGSLTVSGSVTPANEYVGNAGSGTFTQTGGANAVTGNLSVGAGAGSGTYALLGGSATVGGSYTQGANGTFAPGISSATNFEKLTVGGTASLNGTLAPVLLGGYLPTNNQLFPGVITTTGGVSGAFSSVANPTPILSWQVIDPAGTVDLLAKRNYAGAGLNLTHNQANVGAMLNAVQATATGDLANVLNLIAALPSNSAVANAYQQISPEKAAALSTLAFAGANLQKSTLSRRITDLRFGPEDAGLGAVGLGSFNLNYTQGSGLMVASTASSLTGLLTGQKDPGAIEKPWGVYFDPGLILGGQGSSVDQTGFDFAMAGFTAGADYRMWQDLLLGLNTGYTYTNAGFRGSGGYVHGNTWPLTAYAAYLPKPFYAYGSLGYALNLFNLERDINFGGLDRAANSSTTGNQLNAYGETGYDLRVNPVVLTPAVTLSYSKLWLDGFTENGAGALNLTVGPQNAQSLQTGVGGKIAVPMQRNSVTVTPQIYAFYQHEYSDSSRTLDARLSQGGGAFNYLTDDFTGGPHRNFAVLGADVTIASKQNLKVQLDYNAEVGRGNYTAHYLSAGLRWQF